MKRFFNEKAGSTTPLSKRFRFRSVCPTEDAKDSIRVISLIEYQYTNRGRKARARASSNAHLCDHTVICIASGEGGHFA